MKRCSRGGTRCAGSPDPARRLTEGLPGQRLALIQGDLRSNPRRGRETSLFYTSLCCRFRRACPGGSDNWRATPGRYGTPSRSIHGSPPGLSRREHDLRARRVPTQSLLSAGTGPAEISQTCVEQRGRETRRSASLNGIGPNTSQKWPGGRIKFVVVSLLVASASQAAFGTFAAFWFGTFLNLFRGAVCKLRPAGILIDDPLQIGALHRFIDD